MTAEERAERTEEIARALEEEFDRKMAPDTAGRGWLLRVDGPPYLVPWDGSAHQWSVVLPDPVRFDPIGIYAAARLITEVREPELGYGPEEWMEELELVVRECEERALRVAPARMADAKRLVRRLRSIGVPPIADLPAHWQWMFGRNGVSPIRSEELGAVDRDERAFAWYGPERGTWLLEVDGTLHSLQDAQMLELIRMRMRGEDWRRLLGRDTEEPFARPGPVGHDLDWVEEQYRLWLRDTLRDVAEEYPARVFAMGLRGFIGRNPRVLRGNTPFEPSDIELFGVMEEKQ